MGGKPPWQHSVPVSKIESYEVIHEKTFKNQA